MKTYPITIKSTNYTIEIKDRPGDFKFPTREERERWTAALRSGIYKQGKQCLSLDVGSYCCLGVLQFLRDGKELTPETHEMAYKTWGELDFPLQGLDSISWINGDLPASVKVIFNEDRKLSLVQLNDFCLPFADIADVIDIVYNPETYE